MNEEIKIQEFGKVEAGGKFYLNSPQGLPEVAYYTKGVSRKDSNGTWTNALDAFGSRTFIQYDKRVWVKR